MITACSMATACSKGCASYSGKVFRLEQHLDRLWASAKAILLTIPMTKEAVAKAVNDTLAINGIKDGYIRLVVTRGAGSLGLDPNRCSDPQVIVITDHIAVSIPKSSTKTAWTSSPPAPFAIIRKHWHRVKSLNYLNNILAKIEGLQAGCQEASCSTISATSPNAPPTTSFW